MRCTEPLFGLCKKSFREIFLAKVALDHHHTVLARSNIFDYVFGGIVLRETGQNQICTFGVKSLGNGAPNPL